MKIIKNATCSGDWLPFKTDCMYCGSIIEIETLEDLLDFGGACNVQIGFSCPVCHGNSELDLEVLPFTDSIVEAFVVAIRQMKESKSVKKRKTKK